MLRYLAGGLLVGLVLAYTGLSMLIYRPGTAFPVALFFGPWRGLLELAAPYLRHYGFWVYLSAPVIYLAYAALVRWSEKRARLPLVTLLIFVFHYCGVVFSAQMANVGRGEPQRFLSVMKNHGFMMLAGFLVFILVNVLAIFKGWIAKD